MYLIQRPAFATRNPETRTRPGPGSGSGPANFILNRPGLGPGRQIFIEKIPGRVRVQDVNPDFFLILVETMIWPELRLNLYFFINEVILNIKLLNFDRSDILNFVLQRLWPLCHKGFNRIKSIRLFHEKSQQKRLKTLLRHQCNILIKIHEKKGFSAVSYNIFMKIHEKKAEMNVFGHFVRYFHENS